MSKLFIGISGKMGSGKTTLTNNIICKQFNHIHCEVVSLAKPIKNLQDMVYDMLDIDMVGEKDRPLLIALGMWGRGKDPDFWLHQAVKELENSEAEIVICDDVRFENEANWFRDNGILIRLEGAQRGDNVDIHRLKDITETSLDNYPFDNRINNTVSAEVTANSAMQIINEYLRRNHGREEKEEIISRAD